MSFLNSVPGCKSFPSQRHLGTKPNPPGSSINAEYQAAKSEQEVNETRIAELQDKLARAEVIDVSKLSGDTIKFGATVTAIDEDTKEKHVWQIVGEPEADTMKRKISIFFAACPRAHRQTKNATVEVMTPGGVRAYKIGNVEWRHGRPPRTGASKADASLTRSS